MCLQVLYTGDFSREEDRHLVAAEVPPVKPHILISVRSICLFC
jgi:cleavage and polyadenylation specificity factor subunit 3